MLTVQIPEVGHGFRNFHNRASSGLSLVNANLRASRGGISKAASPFLQSESLSEVQGGGGGQRR